MQTGAPRPLARLRGTGRPLLAVVAAVALPLSAVAACGSGLDATTRYKRTTSDAALGDVGPIAVRNVFIEEPGEGGYPSGSSARMFAYIYNNGVQPDRLVEVTADAARRVELRRLPGASETPQPSGNAAPPGAPSPTGLLTERPTPSSEAGAPGSAAPGSSPNAEPVASASAVPTLAEPLPSPSSGGPRPTSTDTLSIPTQRPQAAPGAGVMVPSLEVPAGGRSDTGLDGSAYVYLVGLTEDLIPSSFIPVTMRFERAGTVTLNVPVSLPASPRPRPSSTELLEKPH